MQSKISFFNKAIFLRCIKRNAIISVLFGIIMALVYPYALLTSYTAAIKEGGQITKTVANYYFSENLFNWPVSALITIVVFIVLFINFMFLYNKRDSYMMHAFPVNRRTLFCTGLLAALFSVMVPIVIVALLSTIVGLAYGATSFTVVLFFLYIALGATVFFGGFSILVMMFTGQSITTFVFYGILNFVVLGMYIVYSCVENILGFGLHNMLNEMEIGPATPFFYIAQKCMIESSCKWDDSYSRLLQYSQEYKGGLIMLAYIAVGVAFILIAYWLYTVKKLETVNDFINAPAIKTIFTIGMSFFVSAFFGYATVLIIEELASLNYSMICVLMVSFTVIYGVILFFVIQMLIEKSVRVFSKKNTYYCIIYSLLAILVLLGIKADLFGFENGIPNAEEIKYAQIDGNYYFVYESKEDIQKVIDLNQAILKDKKEILNNGNSDDNYPYIRFKYKLTNGKVLTRSYMLPKEETVSSEKYSAVCEKYYEMVNTPEEIKLHVISPYYDQCKITNLSCYKRVAIEGDDDNWEYVEKNDMTEEEYAIIYEAMLKDIDEGNLFYSIVGLANYNDPDYYENEFYVTIKSEDKQWISDEDKLNTDEYRWLTPSNEHSFQVGLNNKCVNTLKALEQIGFCTVDELDLRIVEE